MIKNFTLCHKKLFIVFSFCILSTYSCTYLLLDADHPNRLISKKMGNFFYCISRKIQQKDGI